MIKNPPIKTTQQSIITRKPPKKQKNDQTQNQEQKHDLYNKG